MRAIRLLATPSSVADCAVSSTFSWASSLKEVGNNKDQLTLTALCGQIQTGIPQLMLARVRGICPDLSKRELDVLCGVSEGRTAQEIGELMGVKSSSVVTYQKRASRRLGFSSHRQLFALCLTPSKN